MPRGRGHFTSCTPSLTLPGFLRRRVRLPVTSQVQSRLCSAAMANPYYDIWRRRELEFTSRKQAREALADEDLLGSFFGRLSEVLTY